MRPVADVLADLTSVPLADVPAAIGQLEEAKARLWARLTTPAAPVAKSTPEPDMIGDVAKVASIVKRSVTWVRRHGHELPGFSQPGGKGTRVLWSREALHFWISSPTS
jgi:hypothetical protein